MDRTESVILRHLDQLIQQLIQ